MTRICGKHPKLNRQVHGTEHFYGVPTAQLISPMSCVTLNVPSLGGHLGRYQLTSPTEPTECGDGYGELSAQSTLTVDEVNGP